MEKVWDQGKVYPFAGTGHGGRSGDGGLATAAKLNGPSGLAIDGMGNVYISELFNHTIRKVDVRTGIISTVAGCGSQGHFRDNGPAKKAMLSYPEGIALDLHGNLYIADSGNHCIRRVDTQGVITTVAGSLNPGFSGDGGPARKASLNHPASVAVDSLGNLYINDYKNDRIRRVEPQGVIYTYAGSGEPGYSGDGGLADFARVNDVYSIVMDKEDNLYLLDCLNFVIRKVEAGTRTISTVWGQGIPGPVKDHWQPVDEAYLSGVAHNKGTIGHEVPHGLDVDNDGNIYVADTAVCRIRVYSKLRNQVRSIAGTCVPGFEATAMETGKLGVHGVRVYKDRIYFFDFHGNTVKYIQ